MHTFFAIRFLVLFEFCLRVYCSSSSSESEREREKAYRKSPHAETRPSATCSSPPSSSALSSPFSLCSLSLLSSAALAYSSQRSVIRVGNHRIPPITQMSTPLAPTAPHTRLRCMLRSATVEMAKRVVLVLLITTVLVVVVIYNVEL